MDQTELDKQYNYAISLLLFLESIVDDTTIEQALVDIHHSFENIANALQKELNKNV